MGIGEGPPCKPLRTQPLHHTAISVGQDSQYLYTLCVNFHQQKAQNQISGVIIARHGRNIRQEKLVHPDRMR